MRKVCLLIMLFVTPFVFSNSVFAHPGRTASDGCHYCRTRCDYWGVPWNERHCHNGASVQGIQATAPVYNMITNTPIPLPTWTPVPTNTPILRITNTPKPTKVVTRTKKVQKQIVEKKTFWQWLFNR